MAAVIKKFVLMCEEEGRGGMIAAVLCFSSVRCTGLFKIHFFHMLSIIIALIIDRLIALKPNAVNHFS